MLDAISNEITAPTANAATNQPGTPGQEVAPMQEARKPNIDSEYASRFAKLTAKESQLRKLEQELKAIREENSRYKELREQAKYKPESVLNEFGLSYEGLTKRMLEGGTDDKYQTIEQRLARIEQREKELETQEKQRSEQQITQSAISQLKSYCEENADEYEFVRLHNAYEDIIDLAAKYYRETGRYMNFDEAARHVEKHLESEAEKLAQSKKLRMKFFPEKEQPQVSEQQKNSIPSKTLSNSGNISAPEGLVTDEQELMKRAIAAYRNATAR